MHIPDFDETGNPQMTTDLDKLAHFAITSGRLPECMTTKTYDCCDCPVQDTSRCPVRKDEDCRSYLLYLIERYQTYQRRRMKQIEVLKMLLNRHKLRLHWGNLAILALREAPDLFDSPDSVRGLVYFNRDIFNVGEDGAVSLVGL